MSARFEPPFIQDNPTGWGPNTIPAQFKDMVSDTLKTCRHLQFFIQFQCWTQIVNWSLT